VLAEDCYHCQKGRAICRSKIQWHNLGDALEAAESLNIERNWTGRTVLVYGCIWCGEWHTKTAKDAYDLRRVERLRRKWLRKQLSL
jgi:hypothetical protein